METIKKKPLEKKLSHIIGIIILIGIILKLMDNAYGPIIFTIGFFCFFLIKILKLTRIQRFFWTRLHTLQLILLILSLGAVVFLYFNFPYARIAFIILLLAESLVNLKLMINKYIGNDNFKTALGFIGKLLRR